jgi:hypothetical protein
MAYPHENRAQQIALEVTRTTVAVSQALQVGDYDGALQRTNLLMMLTQDLHVRVLRGRYQAVRAAVQREDEYSEAS